MIDNLKVKLSAEELIKILENRIDSHNSKARKLSEQAKVMVGDDTEEIAISKFSNSGGANPITSLNDRSKQHERKAKYFTFLRDHIVPMEIYLLDTDALTILEITSF